VHEQVLKLPCEGLAPTLLGLDQSRRTIRASRDLKSTLFCRWERSRLRWVLRGGLLARDDDRMVTFARLRNRRASRTARSRGCSRCPSVDSTAYTVAHEAE
jgi:hypothetical protein